MGQPLYEVIVLKDVCSFAWTLPIMAKATIFQWLFELLACAFKTRLEFVGIFLVKVLK